MKIENLIAILFFAVLSIGLTGGGVKMLRGALRGGGAIFFSVRDIFLMLFLFIAAFFTTKLFNNIAEQYSSVWLFKESDIFLSAIIFQCLIIISFFIVRRFSDAKFSVSACGTSAIYGVKFGVKAVLLFFPLVMLVSMFSSLALGLMTGGEPPKQDVVEVLMDSHGAFALSLSAFSVVVLAPISEELVFRCIIYRGGRAFFSRRPFNRRGARIMGVCVSAAIFALIHFSLMAFLPIFLLGALFAIAYSKTGSIWTPIAMHSVFNTINFALVYLGVASAGEGMFFYGF